MNVKVIAEAGVNHNGNIEIAKSLVDVAQKAGADIIKFQTFKPSSVVTKQAKLARYQAHNTDQYTSQLQMISELCLSDDEFCEIRNYCEHCGIEFLSTAFDIESVKFINDLGVCRLKVPSGEITNYPLLKEIGKCGKPIILSTGMATLYEIGEAIDLLIGSGTERSKITLLHCITEYPAPFELINLRAMKLLKNQFSVEVGYSDHTVGIEVPIAAVTMGAIVIEKHFTLDKNMKGPDHKASLCPEELKRMISAIRNIETALGVPEKIISEAELENAKVIRKSIVASRKINKGEVLTEKNLSTKRPGTGISPMKWNEVIGSDAIRDFSEDDLIEL